MIDTETTTRLSLKLHYDSFLYIKTKPFVCIWWYYHPNFVQKVESQKRTKKIPKTLDSNELLWYCV